MIEGVVIDEWVRLNYPTAKIYYYGYKKGFRGEDYLIEIIGLAQTGGRAVPPMICQVPNKLEELLYF